MHRITTATIFLLLVTLSGTALAADRPLNTAPDGFTNLFNGKDLSGWRGRQGTYSPYEEAKLTQEQKAAKQAAWNLDRDKHWSVDAAKGEVVSDGKGVHLTTDKDYGDFELYVDWLMVKPGADSGIYLRSYPQIQIWDPGNAREKGNGADKGSGALWNNNKDNPGRWPLVLADNPVGQWNTLRVKMVGSRVWIWLNGKQTVDGQILDNYFDRSKPLLPTGPIELQTHGSEIRFRNIYIREIPKGEAGAAREKCDVDGLACGSPAPMGQVCLCAAPAEGDKAADDGFKSIFNGKDFDGWAGPVDQYEIKDGAIVCKPGKGGTIYTREEYGDFEVKLEFKLPPGGNNGLAIRYPGKGDTAYVGMCELQILDDTADKYKKLDPRQYCGSVYGVVAAKRGSLRPVGEWNSEHVIVKGSTIKVVLNGNVIVDADVSTVKEYMGNSKHPGITLTKGFFGFAGHSDPVQFRNIRIKKLD